MLVSREKCNEFEYFIPFQKPFGCWFNNNIQTHCPSTKKSLFLIVRSKNVSSIHKCVCREFLKQFSPTKNEITEKIIRVKLKSVPVNCVHKMVWFSCVSHILLIKFSNRKTHTLSFVRAINHNFITYFDKCKHREIENRKNVDCFV